MRKQDLSADMIGIEKPCREKWAEMTGDGNVRACSHCASDVTDISQMDEREALDLIGRSNGELCIRFEAHPVTGAPVFTERLSRITRQTGVTAGVLGATLAVTAAADAQPAKNYNGPDFLRSAVTGVTPRGSSKARVSAAPQVAPTPPPPRPRPPKIKGRMIIRYRITEPLMRAVNRGQFLKVRLMIARGADVNAVDKKYYTRTALHVAVERNNIKLARMLLDAGADPAARDIYKNTPLMNLHTGTSAEMIRLLASYGTDLNARSGNGGTALINAARIGNLAAVRALLNSGADVAICDHYKNSAYDLAATREIKELLLAYGAGEKVLTR